LRIPLVLCIFIVAAVLHKIKKTLAQPPVYKPIVGALQSGP
jgi:hypothetical protein